jgi:RNA polymerase sigma-70 factor (ECF subfamily)
VVTRLCIDHLRSARARRETYVEALPEPLVGELGAAVPLVPASGPAGVADAAGDPASRAEVADSLSLAFLVLLESLSPEQRAAFLLREVFDYPYDQIAAIVATSEDNARQLVTWAAGTSISGAPGSSHRASDGSAWLGGSSPPPRTATSARSRSCWPTT